MMKEDKFNRIRETLVGRTVTGVSAYLDPRLVGNLTLEFDGLKAEISVEGGDGDLDVTFHGTEKPKDILVVWNEHPEDVKLFLLEGASLSEEDRVTVLAAHGKMGDSKLSSWLKGLDPIEGPLDLSDGSVGTVVVSGFYN